MLGWSNIRYRYSGRYYGNIRVRDLSKAHITARGDGLILIHLFERSCVNVKISERAKVSVIKHSPDVIVAASEGVRILEEFDYLK